MIAKVCEKTKYFGKETTKKTLGKLDRYEIEDQNYIPKDLFSFNFPKPLKQIKIRVFALKLLLKTLLKTLEKVRKMLLKILVKTGLKDPNL